MAGADTAAKSDKPTDKKADKKDPKQKEEDPDADLSDEDLQLKKNIELMVERLHDPDTGVQKLALDSICNEIKTSTSSMTSVPKPLKFLRPHYDTIAKRFEQLPSGAVKSLLADVISVMATTVTGKEGERAGLKYKMQGTTSDLGSWGHEYLRHIAGEIAEEFKARADDEQPTDDLFKLVDQIIPFHMTHFAEPEAVDLLLEVERLDLLPQYVDEKNYARTCLYLVSCCHYLPEPDDTTVLKLAHQIYMDRKKYHDAMRVALMLNNRDTIEQTFVSCSEELDKKQLCYLLARQNMFLNLEEGPCAVEDDTLRDALREIISNSKLSEHFLALARDLDVMEPKTADDVYKTNLVEGRAPSGAAAVDSARQNLATTFVNGFVNAAFGQDKLVTSTTESADSTHWIFKNKDHGKTSATASLGMVTMWDVEGGLPQIDKYLYYPDSYVVAGALLAIGIVNCCVQNENDPAFALISEYVNNDDQTIKTGAILGLGLAYAGTCREEIQEQLLPLVMDTDVNMEVSGFAALALGLVFCSTCNGDISEGLLQTLMMRGEAELTTPAAKQMALALGLLFLGKQEACEATLEVTKTLSERISKFCEVTLETLAYAGTGNVLQIQQLLALCGEKIETEESTAWKTNHQTAAVLGIGVIAMGEPLGTKMAMRMLEHLLQYADQPVRRGVPLAIALLHVSNPEVMAMDALSRLSHDNDTETAQNAVLALGIIGGGTNNARLAGMLRNLASYYYKEPTLLFLVRMAQGLTHMGKGLMTINPYHTDRQLLSGVALAGILSVLFGCMDMKSTITGKHHYLMYTLATAMKPRMLMTLDAEGAMMPVAVRVGQAVDVVAQAGRPKTITGFQTHSTPVLMGAGERAELATDKYVPLSPVLEGLVILKKNPEYVDMD